MDDNMKDLLETVNFIKDNMVMKSDHDDLVASFDRLEKKVDDGFMSLTSRIGGLENRIDEESARRTDLETRVRTVLPALPIAPERV
ncbi:hypothetical protein HYT05_00100 [Candidatus Kaiserbacteria bacterium]|nr:hypothetical protein [Candidatus Kaiserbacteria bacterium]